MEPEKVTHAALVMCIFFSCICFPVMAYSGDAIAWFEQGNVFIKNKGYSDAILAYDKAITLEPGYFEAWNGKADALNLAQHFTDALEVSDRVLILNPDYIQGWINRGYILYNLRRYDEELKAYETAITLNPASSEAWFNKGYSLAGMKRYDEAIIAFKKVEALDPTFPNLAANIRIAEQNRNATASNKTGEMKDSTIPEQSTINAVTNPPAITATHTVPRKSPVSPGGVLGVLLIFIGTRHVRKRKNG
jgi:tetratricopeptide (TPR) repeat protein